MDRVTSGTRFFFCRLFCFDPDLLFGGRSADFTMRGCFHRYFIWYINSSCLASRKHESRSQSSITTNICTSLRCFRDLRNFFVEAMCAKRSITMCVTSGESSVTYLLVVDNTRKINIIVVNVLTKNKSSKMSIKIGKNLVKCADSLCTKAFRELHKPFTRTKLIRGAVDVRLVSCRVLTLWRKLSGDT